MDKVYAAFRSSPDYASSPTTLVSLHETLDGATMALYPETKQTNNLRSRKAFTRGITISGADSWWTGPDGYGLIKLMEIKP